MNQSTYIVGALILGFVLYLAAKGRFTTYAQVLWGQTSAPLPTLPNSGSSQVLGNTAKGVGSVLGGPGGPLGAFAGEVLNLGAGLVGA